MDGQTRRPLAEVRAAELAEHYARILGRQVDRRVSAVVRTCLRRLPARLPIRGGDRRGHAQRGVRADIDAEAIRVVSELPNWKPATSNGKAVNSEMVLPIAFALTAK